MDGRDKAGHDGQAASAVASRTTVVVTDPPACSTAAFAAADAPDTVIVIARPISPVPSSRTPASFRPLSSPAARSVSSVIGCVASSLPASIALASAPRLTGAYSLRNGFQKPRLGSRRYSGNWPPSNPFSATPSRAFWPFTPLPEVLPLPDPIPRPSRFDFSREPGRSRSSLRFISAQLLDLDQVGDLADHPPRRRRVLQLARGALLVEAQPDQRFLLPRLAPERRTHLRHTHLRHWDRPPALRRGSPAPARRRSPPATAARTARLLSCRADWPPSAATPPVAAPRTSP